MITDVRSCGLKRISHFTAPAKGPAPAPTGGQGRHLGGAGGEEVRAVYQQLGLTAQARWGDDGHHRFAASQGIDGLGPAVRRARGHHVEDLGQRGHRLGDVRADDERAHGLDVEVGRVPEHDEEDEREHEQHGHRAAVAAQLQELLHGDGPHDVPPGSEWSGPPPAHVHGGSGADPTCLGFYRRTAGRIGRQARVTNGAGRGVAEARAWRRRSESEGVAKEVA